ncbi:lectin [Amycolatopsis balhimycina DSM 5908]|uniref:Lectin n=1 Tax=Amycolatopsis balhimycina DSM 5908 TaxID=1081091 RepID=A0A428WW50_AMYBA|nr:RICIN domain-containing protein [Amycolatopsis balhimycina]RSM47306.1 lectin [Amycolatopsis balhimycina DSM 5908]
MESPRSPLTRRTFLTAAAAGAGAAALPPAFFGGAGTAEAAVPPQVVLPDRGVFDPAAASGWPDGFVTGNGEYGAVYYGTPGDERVVLDHHRFVLPNGSRGVLPPVTSGLLASARAKALAGDYGGAAATFAGGWNLRWTQTFHPGYQLRLSTPGMNSAAGYARVTDFRSGEVEHSWTNGGVWRRRLFVSRADRVVVHELAAADGRTVDATIAVDTALDGVPNSVSYKTFATISGRDGYLNLRGTYPSGGAYGYEGVTRVVVTGNDAAVTVSGTSLVVARATRVLLLTKLDRYETAGGWDAQALQQALAALPADYMTLLERHRPRHASLYDRSRLDLTVPAADRKLSTSELIARQNGNRSVVDLALLERMYDAGRYLFVSSSGVLPPRLTGLWTGSWNAAWADDFTTDANVNLQVAGGNILSLTESMQGYFDLVLGQLAHWRVNANRLYGARGFLAPTRTDGEYGHMLHFNGSDFPGQCWTGGADWLLYPLLEYYQVTGDADFLRTKLGPALMELALFYEDFLKQTDSAGKVVFVPSFSVENAPASTRQHFAINATGDIMAGKHALQAAIDAAGVLGVEQGSGQGVERWKALLARLPEYTINGSGALAEWSWPGLTDNYNHRHAQHLYGAWPLHEINPEDKPALAGQAAKALDLRGDENLSAHGSLHRAFARARLKDGAGVYANLLKIFGRNMVWRSLVTSHNPDLQTYNTDAANAIPAVVAEALVYTRPGVLELLPALPDQWAKGSITGVRGRNRVLVESLSWDIAGRTVTAVVTSAVTQDITLICRRGIASISTSAPVTPSALGAHARTVSLTADVRTTLTLGLTGTCRLVNQASGKVLDVKGASRDDGAAVIQWPWTGAVNQQWRLLPASGGSVRIVSVNSGKVLDSPGGSARGAGLDQWSDTSGDNQWWQVVAVSGDVCRLVNVRTGWCAEAENSSTADGARIVQNPYTGGAHQQWRIATV